MELCPPNHNFLNALRSLDHGGGIAVVYKNHVIYLPFTAGSFPHFELLTFKIESDTPVCCMVIYRPPGSCSDFITDFSKLLSSIVHKFDKIIIAGDFNIYIDDPSNSLAIEFLNTTFSFNLGQHVSGPTHVHGHTLDLVFTLGLSLNSLHMSDLVSDHKCIIFDTLLHPVLTCHKHTVHSRIFNEQSAARFSALFSNIATTTPEFSDINDSVNWFNDLCSSALDMVAPQKTRLAPVVTPSPWINHSIHCHRRECRQAERRWKKTHLHVHYIHMKELLTMLNQLIKDARAAYFSNLINSNKHNSMLLFNTTNQLLNPAACSGFPATSSCDCDIFLSFFADNISGLRSNFNAENLHLDQATCPILLTEFSPISVPDLFDIISHLHPSSCPTDITPTKFLKEVLPVIALCLLSIVSQSLSPGCIPDYFETACVFPPLKKPT